MAAIGGFGRTRRNGGSNLTSLIASLYREEQAQRDQNIFNAWQNGGQFEGKPVTDQRIIAYIKGRRNEYTKDDPLWDQWNDTLVQTNFSIGEQSITTRYKQGKASAGDVASFYRKQLNSIPKNSAFYRTVAGRAADWAKQAASAARSAARSRASAALQANLAKASRGEAIFDAVTKAIEDSAHKAGLIIGSRADFSDANAAGLIDFVNSLGLKGNGHRVTYEYWQELGRRKVASLNKQIALRKQAGLATKEVRNKRNSFVTGDLANLNALDDRSQYETLHQQFAQDIEDAQGDPSKEIEATNRYVAGLKGLLGKATKGGRLGQDTDDFIGALNNEITSITTGKVVGRSAWDMFENPTAGESTRTDDLTSTVETIWGNPEKGTTGSVQRAEGLANGTMYYGQDKPGAPFDVHPVDPAKGLDQSQMQAVLNIDGAAEPVVLAGQAVEAKNYHDQNGNPVDVSDMSPQELQGRIFRGEIVPAQNVTIGFIYTNPSKPTQHIYGSYDSNGTLRFTDTNPFTGQVAPDGSFIVGSDDQGRLNPGSVVNPNVQATGDTSFIADDVTGYDLVSLGQKLVEQGNDIGGNALITKGQQKITGAEASAKAQMAAAISGYGQTQQIENRNRAEAQDRNPVLSRFPGGFGGQTYAQPTPQVGPAARYAAQFPAAPPAPNVGPPVKPSVPQTANGPQVKTPPQINIPAPPPVVTITPDNGMGSAIGFKTGTKPKEKAPKPPKITYQNNSGAPLKEGKGYY